MDNQKPWLAVQFVTVMWHPTHPFTHSLTHSLSYSMTHSLTHSPTHDPQTTYSLTHSLTSICMLGQLRHNGHPHSSAPLKQNTKSVMAQSPLSYLATWGNVTALAIITGKGQALSLPPWESFQASASVLPIFLKYWGNSIIWTKLSRWEEFAAGEKNLYTSRLKTKVTFVFSNAKVIFLFFLNLPSQWKIVWKF